jgi:TolA-binding protein
MYKILFIFSCLFFIIGCDDSYTESGEVDNATYLFARCYYKLNDFDKARKLLENFISDYPECNYADDSLCDHAGCQVDLNRCADAAATIDEFENSYTLSQYVSSYEGHVKNNGC